MAFGALMVQNLTGLMWRVLPPGPESVVRWEAVRAGEEEAAFLEELRVMTVRHVMGS